jgi:putative molybdopterin biosynthesis protein
MGEDMVATQLVLPAGHILRPVDLGAVAGSGHDRVQVTRRPRVAILPTGTELVPIGQPVREGDIIEYNSMVLAAQVKQWGGAAKRLPITEDDFDLICVRAAQAALENDLVLINAGSSAGSEDFSARVVDTLGEILVHGVAVRPGHPVIIGMIDLARASEVANQAGNQAPGQSGTKIPVIGVPGYPVSSALTGEIFVEPLLARWLGRAPEAPLEVRAKLTRKVTSPAGDDDFMRVALGKVDDQLLAAPLSRGSGVITSLVRADGIAIIPRGSQGLQAGAEVKVRLYRSMRDLERTIFVIGSHDLTLDLIAQYLAARGSRLVSANVGSLGGLVALRRSEAHLAGSHLLDPETGEYNVSYIRQYLPGVAVNLVALVDRQQGLLVPRGNPRGIRSLEDLSNPEVQFVNRQRGAGTRVLLDYHLGLLDIAPEAIRGYTHEEYTHLAVAAAIASGRADCGLGIAAAAEALDLDFLPLYQEHYELVIPKAIYEQALLSPLFEVLADPDFKAAVASLPGYGVERMGELVAEIE